MSMVEIVNIHQSALIQALRSLESDAIAWWEKEHTREFESMTIAHAATLPEFLQQEVRQQAAIQAQSTSAPRPPWGPLNPRARQSNPLPPTAPQPAPVVIEVMPLDDFQERWASSIELYDKPAQPVEDLKEKPIELEFD